MRLFDQAVKAFGCLLLGCLLVTVLAGVVTRGLGNPLIWTDEAARMIMVWLAGTGWILASRARGHVRVRFFQNLLPPTLWLLAERAIQLLTAGLGVAIAWFGVVLVIKNRELEATSLPISFGWLYAPLVPVGIVTAAQAIRDVIFAKRAETRVPFERDAP